VNADLQDQLPFRRPRVERADLAQHVDCGSTAACGSVKAAMTASPIVLMTAPPWRTVAL
jgi:hypothetical protein